jgi:putative nucleotidyltransferase with HDIG domain
LEQGYIETIRALANSIDAKDPYTRGHSVRVTNMALAVGRELKLPDDEIRILRFAGILHDIGKIGIGEAILLKKGSLTREEREIIRTHPVLGEKIIEPVDFLQPVRSLVRHHHEWFDGSGYPDGLRNEEIPFGARIISATDTFDAVTSERPYQKAMGLEQALALIDTLRGKQIDPIIGETLIEVMKKKKAAGLVFPGDWEGDYTNTP